MQDPTGADSLLFLPDSARANLADMGNCVDQEMANSQRDSDLETEAARQSHYIKRSRIMGIPDPCRSNVGYQLIVIFMKYLKSRVNYYNKSKPCSATLPGYATARFPDNFNDGNNIAGVIIRSIIKEKNIAKHQAPL